eukprot:1322111-Amorphochlora_amoeboformis.AAC.2
MPGFIDLTYGAKEEATTLAFEGVPQGSWDIDNSTIIHPHYSRVQHTIRVRTLLPLPPSFSFLYPSFKDSEPMYKTNCPSHVQFLGKLRQNGVLYELRAHAEPYGANSGAEIW